MSKKKLSSGDRVQTNVKYARIIGNKVPFHGTLLVEQSWGSGIWSVNMEGFSKVQLVHERLMEVEK